MLGSKKKQMTCGSGEQMILLSQRNTRQIRDIFIDIIAGHIGTSVISGDPRYHDIYFDGESHYYIDGTVLDSGLIPVLKLDTATNKYYRVTETGDWVILPYDEEN